MRSADERDHVLRALSYATRMTSKEFFSHVTAALIWGVPLPPALASGDLDVGVLAPARLPRGAGVRGHEAVAKMTEVVDHPAAGVRLTSPASTWATLGGVLRDPWDLVAAGDAFVRTWRVPAPLADIEQLEAVVRAGRRVGVNRLREALPCVRSRSASRPESRCRLLLQGAGLPEPALNYEIRIDGEYLGSVDMAYPEARVAIEYEGEHHLLDPTQWSRDIARYDRLREAGWIVIRVTKSDLADNPSALVARVAAALRRRAL